MSGGWIGFDLDGVLAKYDGWKGPTHIGEPVPAMIKLVKKYLAEGCEVRVFTARVSTREQPELDMIHDAIADWTRRHIGVALRATCTKDFAMIHLYDDRCTAVEPNTGRLIGVEEEPC
jgi:hypothetical protein